MKKKNVLMMAMSLVLVAVIAVGGTLAYLTSNSGTLTNTFTVGAGYDNDGFYLDETKKMDGNPTQIDNVNRLKVSGEGDAKSNDYDEMSIGDAIAKDPTAHLATTAPASYVFVKITGVDAMIEAGYTISTELCTDGTYKDAMASAPVFNTQWKVMELDEGCTYDGYYIYKTGEGETDDDYIVDPAVDTMVSLFNSVSIDKDSDELPTLKTSNIVISAAAIQAKNLTKDGAWAEAQKVF